ncbi:MoaD/ThiS family protein [Actinorugispora endophytica]|uniref:Molybdopterin converting factor small subunit n=1 Tax=Actinorugispora endophytica TaxID=1605990 RepID=A0A4R6V6T9_9ACTN|nr:MoaD/ThiS family protein [Actinorugispora endophytica]TDQ54922.1 molybdopterin converting factor small subunit [Actinorugispora endophytica]
MTIGTIRYWAAAKDAAGRAEESFDAGTLAELLGRVRERHAGNAELLRVLERSSFLVGEIPVGRRPHEGVELSEGWTVEVLPPFAGG